MLCQMLGAMTRAVTTAIPTGPGHAIALTAATVLLASNAAAQGDAVLVGRVIDASTKRPVADVVVTATSPSLPGEQLVVTDKTGAYRIP